MLPPAQAARPFLCLHFTVFLSPWCLCMCPSTYNILSPLTFSQRTPTYATKPFLTVTKLTIHFNHSSTSQSVHCYSLHVPPAPWVYHFFSIYHKILHLLAYIPIFSLKRPAVRASISPGAKRPCEHIKALGRKATETNWRLRKTFFF